jgi:cell division protein FtsN
MGAFQIFEDADTLKAELAFMGIPASIQTATVDGKTWFRVRSGPFSSEEAAKKAKDELEEADMPSKIVLG